MLGQPLDQLLTSVDPGACHLSNLPDRIWVFGGPIERKSEHGPASLRDSFWRQTLALLPVPDTKWFSRLDRPENHNEWWAFSGYDNLLQFERDACYLAQATILFAESPGSVAELGALAIDDALVDHLIVVVQTKFLDSKNRESFLNLGPLKRARDRNQLCVIGTAEDKFLPADDVQLVIESVGAWLPPLQKTQIFRPSNPTHQLLLIADLVDLLLVSKLPEIKSAASHFFVFYSDAELTRALKLLEFLELVRIEHRGTETFYVRFDANGISWINYTATAKEPFDRSRFKIDCNTWIVESQSRRKLILERAR